MSNQPITPDALKEQIINEYISGGTTYRKLQEKYGIDFRTIGNWVNTKIGKVKKAAKPKSPNIALIERKKTMPKLCSRWTVSDETVLSALVERGKTLEEMARVLKRSRYAVSVKKSLMGIKKRAKTSPHRIKAEIEAEVEKILSQDLPKTEILSQDFKPVEKVNAEVNMSYQPGIGSQLESLLSKVNELGFKIEIKIHN